MRQFLTLIKSDRQATGLLGQTRPPGRSCKISLHFLDSGNEVKLCKASLHFIRVNFPVCLLMFDRLIPPDCLLVSLAIIKSQHKVRSHKVASGAGGPSCLAPGPA